MKKKTRRKPRKNPSPATAAQIVKLIDLVEATYFRTKKVSDNVDRVWLAVNKLCTEHHIDWKERAAALMLEQEANTTMLNRVPKDFRFGWWARLCLKASGHFDRLCYRPEQP